MPPRGCLKHQVDACVVSYNTRELTLETLKQLHATTQGMPVDIWCWDNGSTDTSAEALVEASRKMPLSVICSHKNVGYGVALNRAFSLGNSPYLLALNSDLQFPQASWLRDLLDYMEANPDVGCTGPLLLDSEGRINGAGVVGTVRDRKIRWWRELWEKRKDQLKEPKDCISVCGAVMLMRRTAFEECHGFDEGFPFYYEETSLHRLMRVFGWRVVFYPGSRVIHMWNKSPKEGNSRKWFEAGDAHFKHIWGDDVKVMEE
ncbi:MAG: glycosyltransferase family 2 protein [Dehalococcoidia bacterium]|nr:glycosyltransferase family 2 protein [Dehalococcoidia bacterium]